MTEPADVLFRDTTLRDGLQLTDGRLPTAAKLELVRELLAIGVPAIEVGSMARPDLVPALADTTDLLRSLTPEELEHCWVWVATPGHVARATEAGARHLQYCLSASDSHNRANLGRPTERSMETLPEALELADAAGATLQFCLSTSFTCPFEGAVDPDRVLELIQDPRVTGASDVVLCDTTGQAVPAQVGELTRRTREVFAGRIVFHGHDTWGQGVANALAAVEAGAGMVDGTLAGLGGCPFAPGASGNTSIEDLAFGLRPPWANPDSLGRLIQAGQRVVEQLSEPNRSRTTEAAAASGPAFAWSLAATRGPGGQD